MPTYQTVNRDTHAWPPGSQTATYARCEVCRLERTWDGTNYAYWVGPYQWRIGEIPPCQPKPPHSSSQR